MSSVALLTGAVAAAAELAGGAPFRAPEQPYLFEARQMQALSLGVHIPLVCFGIAFPAMVLFMEALYLRSGDPVYKAVAKRWSKVMSAVALVVGVGLMIPFEHAATLAVGVACLFAFIVLGVFGLVTPERLSYEPVAGDTARSEEPVQSQRGSRSSP